MHQEILGRPIMESICSLRKLTLHLPASDQGIDGIEPMALQSLNMIDNIPDSTAEDARQHDDDNQVQERLFFNPQARRPS